MASEKEIYEEEKPSSWNFKNYFKGVKRYKWWVLGATIAGVLLGFFSFKFILNPAKKVLSATYTYKLAAELEEGTTTTYRFLDGTLFDCFDVITKENLEAVKASDAETFKDVDVEKIYVNGSIAIEKLETKTTNKDVNDVQLKISAKAASFPSDKVGKQFLFALINCPKQISSKAIEKYEIDSYLDENIQGEEFVKQVSLLKKQYSAIDSAYKDLVSDFGQATSVEEGGDQLYQIYNDFVSKYNDGTMNTVDLLVSQMHSNFYVNYTKGKEADKIKEVESLCEAYSKSYESYSKDLAIYETQLTNLTNAKITYNIADAVFTKQLMELNNQIKELELSINELEKQLNLYGYFKVGDHFEEDASKPSVIKALTDKNADWVKGNDAFRTKISEVAESLKTEREKATTVYKTVYSVNRNKVTLTNAGYVTLSGGISNLVGIAIGLVAGYLISSIVVAAIYIYKDDSKKKEEKEAK